MSISCNVIRKYRVPAKFGISRATFYLWLNPKSPYYQPTLPQEISLGGNSKGFLESELDAWLQTRMGTISAQSAAGKPVELGGK